MMDTLDLKTSIEAALKGCADRPLASAAAELFDVLGYHSEKRLSLTPNTPVNFLSTFATDRPFNPDHALLSEWRTVDFLFQLTDEEVRAVALGDQSSLFESKDEYQGAIVESYLFLTLELGPRLYTRTELSGITRAVNRLFSMPVFLFFRHGYTATLAVIRRRLHKRDEGKDVLEKVTLIKDIDLADPIRAHIEILHDLALPVLYDEYHFHNFVGLHNAWEKRLGSYALNERFYREVAAWYFWALEHEGVELPRAIENIRNKDEREKQRSVFFIRLLTRLIFCWFLQEKRLIPRDLFRARVASDLLRDPSPDVGTYYRAFLQNLFFGTLNQEQEKRSWRKEYDKSTRKGNRGATNLWRYRDLLQEPDRLESLLREHIPFVNGGLFDCLDQVFQEKEGRDDIRLDDFSEESGNAICLPNELFFGGERAVDLSDVYDDQRRKREKARGIIETLSRYKFTVEENTPLEEEIALDPELLGRVFENLLASYNEDTRTTARKALGGFYTPREVVSYMVDEVLISYLQTAMAQTSSLIGGRLRSLFAAQPESFTNDFNVPDTELLIAAIGKVKILDPACGSGAFPMGALHRMVDLLKKLDPENIHWREFQRRRAVAETDVAFHLGGKEERERRLMEINEVFEYNTSDYGRKLFLIENCIFGVDIQPIATQIAKLRFFIALIVDQRVEPNARNLGVRPLPNLETKIVAADTLIPLEKPHGQIELLDTQIRPLREELELVRHAHFNARTPSAKARCRQHDAEIRARLADLLKHAGLPAGEASALAAWDPYDQNHAASFFDSDWMFGLPVGVASGVPSAFGSMESGFDVVLGNPPYVRIQTLKQQNPQVAEFYRAHYESARKGNYDLYVVFVEAGLNLLKRSGHLAYILPHKFFNAQYGEPLRELLARGRHVQQIVHFGDQQVFPGATNYVCLLFLSRGGVDACHFILADRLSVWLKTFRGTERRVPASRISGSEWNFVVGVGAELFDRLAAMPNKLGELTDIFVGLQTSADDVFILNLIEQTEVGFRLHSKVLDEEVILESKLLRPIVSGTDVGSFTPLPSRQFLVFPYDVVDESAALVPFSRIKKDCPKTAAYLLRNRQRLEEREGGKFRDDEWYRFGRSQNLGIQERPKVCVPRLVDVLHASIDLGGKYYLDNVDVGGMTWKPQYSQRSLQFIAAMVNSSVLRWFFPQVSAPFRGGFRSANRQFISLLPIPPANPTQESQLQQLVDYLLTLNSYLETRPEIRTIRDTLMLRWWEQVVNGLVYELYFQEELHSKNLHLFDLVEATGLPHLDGVSDEERLARLRGAFERTYESSHLLRGALFDLGSLEVVRIIEGRK